MKRRPTAQQKRELAEAIDALDRGLTPLRLERGIAHKGLKSVAIEYRVTIEYLVRLGRRWGVIEEVAA